MSPLPLELHKNVTEYSQYKTDKQVTPYMSNHVKNDPLPEGSANVGII